MTGRARVRGKPSHALVEMYTQPIKIVIIVAHFSLRSITQSSTAKGDFGNTIHITGGKKKKKEKGYVMLGQLLNWRLAHL